MDACARKPRRARRAHRHDDRRFPGASQTLDCPDSDGDGVSDRVESRRLHTNPRKADTDRDKLGDGVEARVTRTNPRRMDTDRDGLTDGFEVKRSKTKPRRFDTDGDRTGDGLELLLGRNPLVRDRPKKKLIVDPGSHRRAAGGAAVAAADPLPDPPPLPDLLPPETSISSGPSGTVTTGSASFGFTSSETGSTFECRLDAGAWGVVRVAEGVFRAGERLAHLQRARDGRRG